MYDAIEYRGASQAGVETLAKYAGVPVFNGLTGRVPPDADARRRDDDARAQRQADPRRSTYAFLGDTRNNMGHSLMIVGCLLGMDVRICGPEAAVARRTIYLPIARRAAGAVGRDADDHRRPAERPVQRRRLRPHRRVGLDGRAEGSLEGAHRPAAAATRSTCRADEGQPATRRSSSCTACRRSTTPRPRSASRSPRPTASRAASR